jgi:hypothetical protein
LNPESLDASIDRLVKMQTEPGKMMKEIRKLHPKASKKQIIRAAFALMIENADRDLAASRALQNFGISAGRSAAD